MPGRDNQVAMDKKNIEDKINAVGDPREIKPKG